MSKNKEKSPHQIRWEAYRQRLQAKKMANEARDNRNEKIRTARAKRKAGSAVLARGVSLILVFALFAVVMGFINPLEYGKETTTLVVQNGAYNSSNDTYSNVYMHSFRFDDERNAFDMIDDGFTFVSHFSDTVSTLYKNLFGDNYQVVFLYGTLSNKEFLERQFIVLKNAPFDPVMTLIKHSTVNYSSVPLVNFCRLALNGKCNLYDSNNDFLISYNIASPLTPDESIVTSSGWTREYDTLTDCLKAGRYWIDNSEVLP